MDERYEKVQTPPAWAKKEIRGGANNGKTDIRPQWRIDALTEVYGLCGVGWYAEPPVVSTHEIPGGELNVNMIVALHVWDKDREAWSAPIIGVGGDRVIKKDRNGLHIDEDAYKKCFTDALGKAASMLGVGADVYRGEAGKYEAQNAAYAPQPQRGPAQPAQGAQQGQGVRTHKPTFQEAREALRARIKAQGLHENDLTESIKKGVLFDTLGEGDLKWLSDNLDSLISQYRASMQGQAAQEDIPF